MSEKLWHLKNCQIFEQLPADVLRRLESRSKTRVFERKSPIYLPAENADSVLVLVSGRAKICHLTPEGKQSILTFVEPGELFGELAILDSGPRDEYAETVDESQVVMIPGEVVQQLMQQYPHVSLSITRMMGMRRKRVERRLKNLLFLSNRDRLTHLLLELVEQYGESVDDGVQLKIKLSHQDLANIIGSTRESVTVVLGQMQHDKLIRVGRRRILLLDLGRLAASVDRQPPERVGGKPAPVH